MQQTLRFIYIKKYTGSAENWMTILKIYNQIKSIFNLFIGYHKSDIAWRTLILETELQN
jgi:hypothetical protein